MDTMIEYRLTEQKLYPGENKTDLTLRHIETDDTLILRADEAIDDASLMKKLSYADQKTIFWIAYSEQHYRSQKWLKVSA
jgi:hypothetical protein